MRLSPKRLNQAGDPAGALPAGRVDGFHIGVGIFIFRGTSSGPERRVAGVRVCAGSCESFRGREVEPQGHRFLRAVRDLVSLAFHF